MMVLSLGIPQQASAPSVSAAPLASANDQPNEANRRIMSYLTKKFGVARARAAKLADIVSEIAAKYSLPPALRLRHHFH